MSTATSPDPATMMQLAAIAYEDDLSKIPNQVTTLVPGWEVVWGPAQKLPFLDPIPVSAAYVACNSATGEYAVVIRGTDWESIKSWTGEDFDVGTTQLFSQLLPKAKNLPSTAAVSTGTWNGMQDLIDLKAPEHAPGEGTTILGYLQSVSPTSLYVTGHSLGGTLTPPMFAYLNYYLNQGSYTDSMVPCSFAGLTPGNPDFNSYFTGLFNAQNPWRYYNPFDFAPLCWWSLADIEAIYLPHHKYGDPEKDLVTKLFDEIQANGLVYAQPTGGDKALPGKYNDKGTASLSWVTQAAYQHDHNTYLGLVSSLASSTAAAS